MSIDLDGLRGFVSVAGLGTFHEAASALAVSQSALSRRVQKLEEGLGISLLARTTRRVTLTAAGRDFLPRAQKLLEALDDSLLSVRDLAAREAGRVTIACVPSVAYYFLPAALQRFDALFPDIHVRIVEDAAAAVLQRVREGEAEVGVTFLGQADEDIDFVPVIRDPFVLACRHDHPLARQAVVRWPDLRPYRFITAGLSSGNRLLLDRAFAQAEWRPTAFYEVRHLPSSLGLVEAGLGVVALPRLSLPGAAHPVIAGRRLVEPEIIRTVGVVRRRGVALAAPARELFRVLAERRVEDKPGWLSS
ncbi:LysR substrate-binding domain-containing protein [Roseomonas sp. F4]